ncbi:hypothetical protein [Devosia sp.]|uniref:hypothetical protein n=1 Tax=Devosia sp. TaxID=1871048 RepID=UPI003F72FBCE
MIRSASALQVQLEQLDAAWTHVQPGAAELDAYSRLSNTLRRHLAAIGLGTKKQPAQGSVLDRYLTSKGSSK